MDTAEVVNSATSHSVDLIIRPLDLEVSLVLQLVICTMIVMRTIPRINIIILENHKL